MAVTELITIGVYGWDEAGFFSALQRAGVDTFCDVRERRGLRGSEYAFANSQRLQARLAELGIHYVHRRDLAPTREQRDEQHASDKATHTAKRARTLLGASFADRYRSERLSNFDSRGFVEELGPTAQVVAIFCVERTPEACHRSLLAERLAQDLDLKLAHIVP